MIRTALIILAIELVIIGFVRSRYGSRARDEIGGTGTEQPATSV
jgi:hypothetical protein